VKENLCVDRHKSEKYVSFYCWRLLSL